MIEQEQPIEPVLKKLMNDPPMNDWMVRYTSLMSTPCLSALSRSTAMKRCGTLGMNVVLTVASSGRLRAAARNLLTLAARKPIDDTVEPIVTVPSMLCVSATPRSSES